MLSIGLFFVGLAVGVVAEAIARERSPREILDEPKRVALVAAPTALIFAGVPLVVEVDWALPAYLWFVGVTVTLTVTDIDAKLIPNRILFPGTLAGVALLTVGAIIEGGAIVRALAGGGVYFALLFVIALIARGGFGFGDVKLAFLLGLFTAYQSWDTLIVAVFAAFLLGGVVSLILIVFRLRDRKDSIPFGPYLVAGSYLALAWGATIADWYLGGSA